MLKSLTYSVTFPTTGRTLSKAVQFKDGFGAIVGPNESGKSFIIEVIRWMLFGTKALRGKADDYKTLKGQLEISIRGVDYVIERTQHNAKVLRDGAEIAGGTRPVNEKVVQLLGYGLTVFDTAHVANQGDLEALSSMQPTERKRMVDSVIGLGVIEDLAKSAGEEANALKRRAEDLKATLVEPTEPAKPEGYRPAAEIRIELDGLAALKTEFDQLQGWLSHKRAEPVEPECVVKESLQELTKLVEQQQTMQAERMAILKQIDDIPVADQSLDVDAIEAQIEAWENYQRRQAFLKLHPQPSYSDKDLKAARRQLQDWENWQHVQNLIAKRDKLAGRGHHTCPKCEHQFPVAAEEIANLEIELVRVPQPKKEPATPALSLDQIEREERISAAWASVQEEWDQLQQFEAVDPPPLDRHGLAAARAALVNQGRREKLVQEVKLIEAQLAEMPDYNKPRNARLAYEHAMNRYEVEVEEYQRWKAEADVKRSRLEVLERIVVGLPTVQGHYEAARSYELQLANYHKALDVYTSAVAQATSLASEATDWGRAREALTTLRALVKQHLVPSLNKVASHLIKQMTGGQRQSIVVDEDFNITVDNQAINTLSGSGKAVANLALRIGLGQVLTNNVVSLFMGDEIDASMDKDRAENTANTLQTLKNRISQILLVTHKLPCADYYISLGNNTNDGIPEQ